MSKKFEYAILSGRGLCLLFLWFTCFYFYVKIIISLHMLALKLGVNYGED